MSIQRGDASFQRRRAHTIHEWKMQIISCCSAGTLLISGLRASVGQRFALQHSDMPWAALDAQTGLPKTPEQFPKLALRAAFHQVLEDQWRLEVGDKLERTTRGREDWDIIKVEYVCVEAVSCQGSGATFKKYYFSPDKQVQWIHLHKKTGQSWEATQDTFTIFPP